MKRWIINYSILYAIFGYILLCKGNLDILFAFIFLSFIIYIPLTILFSYMTANSITKIDNIKLHIIFKFILKILFSLIIGICFVVSALIPVYIVDLYKF